MRIIAGEFRGRKLLSPRGTVTRPITDRVKQSLFDILAPLLRGAHVYDCFAGAGSLGLESLSRGAARASFFEKDASALALLRQNIAALGLQARAAVIGGDFFTWLNASSSSASPPADLIFFDPPYRFLTTQNLVEPLSKLARHHLRPGGAIVFRHDAKDRLPIDFLHRCDERIYGGMMLEFLQPVPT